MHHEAFNWFSYVGLGHFPYHIVAAGFVTLILFALSLVATLKLAALGSYTIPSPKVNLLNIFDIAADGLYGLTKSMLGKDAPTYFPLVGSIFLYVWFSNILGLIPGFNPPTDNINTTLAVGLFVFVYYNWVGLKTSGLAYLKHFLGPVWYIAPLLLPIEIISHFVRPFSLGMRLYGNMTGDHMVLAQFTELAPYVVPIIFYFLGIMVCTIQAAVFTILTLVYIMMAKESDHH